MKIREIRAAGLRGATPEGGWDDELQQDDCVHTLIAVITDEGPVGLGSVFTSEDLVRGRWLCSNRWFSANRRWSRSG